MPGTFNPPSITSAIKRRTTNFSMAIPYFDTPGWGTALERDLDIIDASLYLAIGITNIQGAWDNGTDYEVGDRVVNVANNTIYQCLVSHTSATTGTFNDDIAAHPTYWRSMANSVSIRSWVTATQFNAGEYITDGGRTGIATETFTSGASYDADVTAEHIVTIVDVSSFSTIEVAIHAAGSATLADSDEIGFVDASNSNALAKTTWSGIKSLLGAIYQPLASVLTNTTASFTSAQETKLSGISTGADVALTTINAATEKSTPVDDDHIVILDSASSNAFKRLLFSDLAAWILTKMGFVGICVDYAGTTAPSEYWELAYGQSVLRTDYPALFAVIGTTFGAADATHFNFPDLRGRVTAGYDSMGGTSANRLTGTAGGVDGDTFGSTGGAETHALLETELAEHDHEINPPSTSTSSAGSHAHSMGLTNQFGDGNDALVGSGPRNFTTSTNSGGSHTHTVNIPAFNSGTAGSGSGHNNVQPTIILNKLIFTGV